MSGLLQPHGRAHAGPIRSPFTPLTPRAPEKATRGQGPRILAGAAQAKANAGTRSEVSRMPREEDEDARTYTVVVNDEGQYSIWLADREIPAGWRATGTSGRKAECLAHIKTVWTDMRPLGLRT
jgi:MbtH protein